MARHRSVIWLGLAGLLARASAECTCAGTDYTHGGTYFIDENSEAYFEFSSIFEGERIYRPPGVSGRDGMLTRWTRRLHDGLD